MNCILHELVDKIVEFYVDDVVIKGYNVTP
jgi:hypothetical protein